MELMLFTLENVLFCVKTCFFYKNVRIVGNSEKLV